MENEEDEEQRRERIQAEENGQDLGAALGIVLGLASTLLEDEDPLPQEEGPALLKQFIKWTIQIMRSSFLSAGI